ncbi:MAG: MobV family relaxase, partial [Waterburya sp.]
MAHAIARIAKLKAGTINASELHVNRERLTPNANEKVANIRFVGEGDLRRLDDIVRERIGEQTIRKNAVLCVEMLLTASPEYFRPDEPSKAGYYVRDRLENWQQAVKGWLDDEYGDRIVRAELHLDESTPHIHAYLVPLDERGKLNCRGIFGGRQKLSQFQDSYASAMSPLGLERGIKGSKARHTKVKQYYAAVNRSPNAALDDQTIHQQLADRTRAIRKEEQASLTAKSLSKENQKLQQRLEQAENKIRLQNDQLKSWKKRYQDIANEVRELPLNKVASELGLSVEPKDKHKWKGEEHIINITGSKFYDWKEMKGGGGAVDLVMHINECDFKQAVVWLSDRFGEGETIEAVTFKAREIIKTEPVPEFTPPAVEESKWQFVKKYLTQQRKLPSRLIDQLHEQGLIYADAKQNAVFVRRSLDQEKITGATLRGTAGANNTFKGLAKGTRRSEGWFYFEQGEQSVDSIKRVVLVESPIDAMSLAVMERTDSKKTLYLSTDGAGQLPLEFLQEMKEVAIAYDNDDAGELMAQRVKSQLPEAVRKTPKAVDWNQDLVNTF